MSVFNLEDQNSDIDLKITAGLERLSLVFKTLLWEKAKVYNLSPIQIQILIFIDNHSTEKSTVSYLAKEFNVTKPTISDAIRVLENKLLISKTGQGSDNRSYYISLSPEGKAIVLDCNKYTLPITNYISQIDPLEKEIIWKNIFNLIHQLVKTDVITVQRCCTSCINYSYDGHSHFCKLLQLELKTKDLRIDCGEFVSA